MPIDLSRIGIEPDDPAYQPLLRDLQGNILKGNGRNWSVFLFIRFKADDPAAARGWIGDFARAFVTAAQVQEEQAAAFRASKLAEKGGLFASFFLSAQGYLTLGFSYEKLPRDSQAWFNAGMQARQGALRDPRVNDWQAEFREPVNAMALLASDDEAEVRQHATDLQAQLAGIGADAWAEVGSRWFNEEQLDVEPFGYVNGASNPRFFRNDIDRAKAVGGDRWDPSALSTWSSSKIPTGSARRATEASSSTASSNKTCGGSTGGSRSWRGRSGRPPSSREPMRSADSRMARRSSSGINPRGPTPPRTISTIPATPRPPGAPSTLI